MTTTIVAKQLIRQGDLLDMPILSPGEFGLATDEQRLFLGQQPIVGTLYESLSDATFAVLDFSTKLNGVSTLLDLEEVNEFKIVVNDTYEIPSANVAINDTKFTVQHGLGVPPATASDTFKLYYNKEITSYRAETDSKLQSTLLEKSQPYGTPESTGIDFLSAVKNHITIEYFLHTATDMRKGQLDIAIQGNDIQSITDTYNSNSGTLDVEFTISNDNAGLFTLDYDTSYVGQIQFNYIQKSFSRTTSA
jgi:hypothetical protein